MSILNTRITATVADEQTNLFTPQHILYKVVIKTARGQYTTSYQCNARQTPDNRDILCCLYLDSTSADYADVWEFAQEFGYTIDSRESFKHVESILKACKRTAKALERIFTSAELAELAEFAQEW